MITGTASSLADNTVGRCVAAAACFRANHKSALDWTAHSDLTNCAVNRWTGRSSVGVGNGSAFISQTGPYRVLHYV
jgi:hypothetical protein